MSDYDPLVIHAPPPLPTHHRLFDELLTLRDEVAQTLELPPCERPIHVHLFRSGRDFRDFLDANYPDLGTRRAIFVESEDRLAVYAHWSDRAAEDLRHEVTHGYLHAGASVLPIWLDEGLAEYFEVHRGQRGVNQAHLDLLETLIESGNWQPDLQRLEHISAAAGMRQLDYAEAWAWVHCLLESSTDRRTALCHFLNTSTDESPGAALSSQLAEIGPTPAELLEHVRGLGRVDDSAISSPASSAKR